MQYAKVTGIEMSKHRISKSVICPYYKHEDTQVIYCNGVKIGTVLHLAFASPTDAKIYKREICQKCWKECKIAKMLSES